MPYFIQRYQKSESTLKDIFESHKEEAIHHIEMLEAYKLKFNKILDHMKTFISQQPEKKPKTCKVRFDSQYF